MNEIHVEDFCRSKGVEIVHPQLLTLAEKIEVISEANMIIGRPGTSFLNLMFRRNPAPLGVSTCGVAKCSLWMIFLECIHN